MKCGRYRIVWVKLLNFLEISSFKSKATNTDTIVAIIKFTMLNERVFLTALQKLFDFIPVNKSIKLSKPINSCLKGVKLKSEYTRPNIGT